MIYLLGRSIILKIFSSCKCMTDGLLKDTNWVRLPVPACAPERFD